MRHVTCKYERLLESHYSNLHNWKPRPCPTESCQSVEVFSSKKSLRRHRRKEHTSFSERGGNRYSAQRGHPECQAAEDRSSLSSREYQRHLQRDHLMATGVDRKSYALPTSRPNSGVTSRWVPRICIRSDCLERETRKVRIWEVESDIKQQLKKTHKMSNEEADAALKNEGTHEDVVALSDGTYKFLADGSIRQSVASIKGARRKHPYKRGRMEGAA